MNKYELTVVVNAKIEDERKSTGNRKGKRFSYSFRW